MAWSGMNHLTTVSAQKKKGVASYETTPFDVAV